MGLNVSVLSAQAYDSRLKAFIKAVEGVEPYIYVDTGDNPTGCDDLIGGDGRCENSSELASIEVSHESKAGLNSLLSHRMCTESPLIFLVSVMYVARTDVMLGPGR